MSLRSFVVLCGIGALLSIGVSGCPSSSTSKAVLAGTWLLTPGASPNTGLGQVLLTFDANGNLSSLSFVFNGVTLAGTGLTGTTAVTGNIVTITATFGINGNSTLTFNGTLNSTDTMITGQSSFTLVIGSAPITLPTGSATLTKQPA